MNLLDVLAGAERLSDKQDARVAFLLDAAINIAGVIVACFTAVWLVELLIAL